MAVDQGAGLKARDADICRNVIEYQAEYAIGICFVITSLSAGRGAADRIGTRVQQEKVIAFTPFAPQGKLWFVDLRKTEFKSECQQCQRTDIHFYALHSHQGVAFRRKQAKLMDVDRADPGKSGFLKADIHPGTGFKLFNPVAQHPVEQYIPESKAGKQDECR
ncbi:hypothetical protein DSECCO2_231290 [anaerobic digester metagenome]